MMYVISEQVAGVVGRADLLAAAFLLISFTAYHRSVIIFEGIKS